MHNILAQITVANIGTFEQAEFKNIVDTSSSQTILEILKSFGVEGQIVGTETGPIVTSVYFAPAPGIRINSITERTDDLQVALGVSSLKITLAPEKKAVAIEVPNPHPCKIPFGNIFHSAHNGMRLPAALGVDTKATLFILTLRKLRTCSSRGKPVLGNPSVSIPLSYPWRSTAALSICNFCSLIPNA